MRKALFQPQALLRALMGGVFVFTLILGSQAMAADDDDEESFEEKLMNNLLGTNKPVIDYRERSPLVVPPTSTLPSPEATQTVTNNPAWPKDADNQRVRKTKRNDQYERNKYRDYSGRPLLPNEVEGKGRASNERVTPDPRNSGDNAAGRALTPYELGDKGNVFSSIFSSKEKTESAVFLGEPARGSLTEPPRGYLTPSPNYPYGLSPTQEAPKPIGSKLDERAVGRE